jgi:hypothetical protein
MPASGQYFRPFIVRGLQPSTRYRFIVRAFYTRGPGGEEEFKDGERVNSWWNIEVMGGSPLPSFFRQSAKAEWSDGSDWMMTKAKGLADSLHIEL